MDGGRSPEKSSAATATATATVAEPSTAHKKPRKLLRRFFIFSCVLLLLLGGAALYLWSFLNGRALRKAFNDRLCAHLSREADADKVELDLWNGTLTVEGVKIYNRQAVTTPAPKSARAAEIALNAARQDTLARIKSIRGEVRLWPLLRSRGKEIRAGKVVVENPELCVERLVDPQTGLRSSNADDIVARLFGGAPTQWPKPLGLDALEAELEIVGGSATLVDRGTDADGKEIVLRECRLHDVSAKIRQPGLGEPLSFDIQAEARHVRGLPFFAQPQQPDAPPETGRLRLKGSAALLSKDAKLDPALIRDGQGELTFENMPAAALWQLVGLPECNRRFGGFRLMPGKPVFGRCQLTFPDLSRLHFFGQVNSASPAEISVLLSLFNPAALADTTADATGVFSPWAPLWPARADVELTLGATGGGMRPLAWRINATCAEPAEDGTTREIFRFQSDGGSVSTAAGLDRDAPGFAGTTRFECNLDRLADSDVGKLLNLYKRLTGVLRAETELKCAAGDADLFGRQWLVEGTTEFQNASLLLAAAGTDGKPLRQPLVVNSAFSANVLLADDGRLPPVGGLRFRFSAPTFLLETREPFRWRLPTAADPNANACSGVIHFKFFGDKFWREWGPLLRFLGVTIAPVEEEVEGTLTVRRGAESAADPVAFRKQWIASLALTTQAQWDAALPPATVQAEFSAEPEFIAAFGEIGRKLFGGFAGKTLRNPALGSGRFKWQAAVTGKDAGASDDSALAGELRLHAGGNEILLTAQCPSHSLSADVLAARFAPYRRYLPGAWQQRVPRGRWTVALGATLRRTLQDDLASLSAHLRVSGEQAGLTLTPPLSGPTTDATWIEPRLELNLRGSYQWRGGDSTAGVLRLTPPETPEVADGSPAPAPAALALDTRAGRLRLNAPRWDFGRAALLAANPAETAAAEAARWLDWSGDFSVRLEAGEDLAACADFLRRAGLLPSFGVAAADFLRQEWSPATVRLELDRREGQETLSRLVLTAAPNSPGSFFTDLDVSVSTCDARKLLTLASTDPAWKNARPRDIALRRAAFDPRPFLNETAPRPNAGPLESRLFAATTAARRAAAENGLRIENVWRLSDVTLRFDPAKESVVAAGAFDSPVSVAGGMLLGPWTLERFSWSANPRGFALNAAADLTRAAWRFKRPPLALHKPAGDACTLTANFSWTEENDVRTLNLNRFQLSGGPLPAELTEVLWRNRAKAEDAPDALVVGRCILSAGPLPLAVEKLEFQGTFNAVSSADFFQRARALRVGQITLELPAAMRWAQSLPDAEKTDALEALLAVSPRWEAPFSAVNAALLRAPDGSPWTLNVAQSTLACAGENWRVRGSFSVPNFSLALKDDQRAAFSGNLIADGLELRSTADFWPGGTYLKAAGTPCAAAVVGEYRADGALSLEKFSLSGGPLTVEAQKLALSGQRDETGARPGFIRADALTVGGGPLPLRILGLDYVGPVRALAAGDANENWKTFRALRINALTCDPRPLQARLRADALKSLPAFLRSAAAKPGVVWGAPWGAENLTIAPADRAGTWTAAGDLTLHWTEPCVSATGAFRLSEGFLTSNDGSAGELSARFALDAAGATLRLADAPTPDAKIEIVKERGRPTSARAVLRLRPDGGIGGDLHLDAAGATVTTAPHGFADFFPSPYVKQAGEPFLLATEFAFAGDVLNVAKIVLRLDKATLTATDSRLRAWDRFATGGAATVRSLRFDVPLPEAPTFSLNELAYEAGGDDAARTPGRLRFLFTAPRLGLRLAYKVPGWPRALLVGDAESGLESLHLRYDDSLAQILGDPWNAFRRITGEAAIPKAELYLDGVRAGETLRFSLDGRLRVADGRVTAPTLRFRVAHRLPPGETPATPALDVGGQLDGLSVEARPSQTHKPSLLVNIPVRLTAPLALESLREALNAVPPDKSAAPAGTADPLEHVEIQFSLAASKMTVATVELTDLTARNGVIRRQILSLPHVGANLFGGTANLTEASLPIRKRTAAPADEGLPFKGRLAGRNLDLAALQRWAEDEAHRAASEKARQEGKNAPKRKKDDESIRLAGRLDIDGDFVGQVGAAPIPIRKEKEIEDANRWRKHWSGDFVFTLNELTVSVPKNESVGLFVLGGLLNLVGMEGFAAGLNAYADSLGFAGKRLTFAPCKISATLRNGRATVPDARILGRGEAEGLVAAASGSLDLIREEFRDGLAVTAVSLPPISRQSLRLDEWRPEIREQFLRDMADNQLTVRLTGKFSSPSTVIPLERVRYFMREGLKKPPAPAQ